MAWLNERHDWTGLKSIVRIDSERDVAGVVSRESRYFISSLAADPEKLLKAVRGHWAIENNLHWQLDVSFNEDSCLVRHRNAARVFALTRKLCFNAIKRMRVKDYSIRTLRKGAAWDPNYREQVLMAA